jgi:hypothetical protein
MELVSWGDSNGFYLYMLQAFREIRVIHVDK